jgi:three-Cys-motif partner protein
MSKTNKNFHWRADGEELPPTEPHSKAKHKVLEDYIKNWIATLCGNNIGNSKTVTLIDGFCGGGMYRDPENGDELWPGSPIRMIRSVQQGLNIVKYTKLKPTYELRAKYIFIDERSEYLDCLKLQMCHSGFSEYINNPEKCEFICGKFEDTVHKVLKDVKERGGSSFFFLDPLGYTDVSMERLREIVALGKSEVLYTFMIDFIRRFLSQRDESLKNALGRVLEAEGYYTSAMSEDIDTQSNQAYLRNETMRLFRDKGGARYVYSFALLHNASLVKYYLIHLASSSTAQKVMKNSLWELNNMDIMYQFRYEVYGLGFRTPNYYDHNGSVFNFQESNTQAAIQNLDTELMPTIHNAEDGIELGSLHNQTMQTNPATWEHYMRYVNEQRSNKEIQVFRDGKITTAKNLKPGDVI